ncbi:hypothetical protein NBRC110019_14160 [Neptunitalea chrysea]|uniref:thioredoxin-dependent peroxiredoxin n=1 Tax=Neptunitalea chrysea TaxID=1647581 RepID=A0A9W6B4H1_9FLAO|nr:peroxiredoxin-like family protein [Neptunitalea chrysea]GLB52376.1 hypothetical protein NBRC110019_14160 [Neptunitalea chrysea]
MKKLLSGMFAISLIIACNNTTKKAEEPARESTKEPETSTPDLTAYGIEQGGNPLGLPVNSIAPDVTLTFQDGNTKSLSELYKEQPLVVFFYRGYWCPYCSKYLSEMATEAQDLEMLGAKLIAVTPETYGNVNKTKLNSQATFDIVSDTSGDIMNAFKVNFDVTNDYQEKLKNGASLDLRDVNSSKEAILPIPATYVINQEGKIVYSFTNPDYKQRAPISEISKHIPPKM